MCTQRTLAIAQYYYTLFPYYLLVTHQVPCGQTLGLDCSIGQSGPFYWAISLQSAP